MKLLRTRMDQCGQRILSRLALGLHRVCSAEARATIRAEHRRVRRPAPSAAVAFAGESCIKVLTSQDVRDALGSIIQRALQ